MPRSGKTYRISSSTSSADGLNPFCRSPAGSAPHRRRWLPPCPAPGRELLLVFSTPESEQRWQKNRRLLSRLGVQWGCLRYSSSLCGVPAPARLPCQASACDIEDGHPCWLPCHAQNYIPPSSKSKNFNFNMIINIIFIIYQLLIDSIKFQLNERVHVGD